MVWTCLLLLTVWCATTHAFLYPVVSETRQIRSLDGLWQFKLDEQGEGQTQKWFTLPTLPEPTLPMPVPSSYNDITQNHNQPNTSLLAQALSRM